MDRVVDAQAQFAARAKQINDAYSGKKNQTEREKLLAQNNALEQQYIEWLKKQAAKRPKQPRRPPRKPRPRSRRSPTRRRTPPRRATISSGS
jgi:hypothetical protein